MDGARSRVGEILARIEAWTDGNAGRFAAGEDLRCDLYNEVIHHLPEFDPLDPGNREFVFDYRYVLLDGTVIDGTTVREDGRPEWRVIAPG